MRALIAVDKFKGTLTAAQVTDHLRPVLEGAGIRVDATPLADGGDGTLEAARAAGFSLHEAPVTGPLGGTVTAQWALRGEQAIIEMAEASGLALLQRQGGSVDPASARAATSVGTGELIAHAVKAGARSIVLGLGGSATTDGGLGMLMGLGAVVFDAHGQRVDDPRGALGRATEVDMSGPLQLLDGIELTVACDVDNPLTGERGAAAVFGPQKGADEQTVEELDVQLAEFARLLKAQDTAGLAGAGAAGGMGFAALVLGARMESGADLVLDLTGFDKALAEADVVITGEGRFDVQTLSGKGPAVVIDRAHRADLPVFVVCGSADPDVPREGLAGLFQLTDKAPVEQAMSAPGPVLTAVAGDLAAAVLSCLR